MRHCFEANFMDITKRTPWKKKKVWSVYFKIICSIAGDVERQK